MRDPKVIIAVALIAISTIAAIVGPKVGLDTSDVGLINAALNTIALVLGVQAPNAQTRALLAAQEKTE